MQSASRKIEIAANVVIVACVAAMTLARNCHPEGISFLL